MLKRVRIFLCMLLSVAMLAGDLSMAGIQQVQAATEQSVSGNEVTHPDAGDETKPDTPETGEPGIMDEATGEQQDVSDGDLTVSENASDVSGNEITVSANDLKEASLSEEALDKLQQLLTERERMALVYLTDAYPVKKEADSASDTVATLASGQTVVIRDIALKKGTVWYQVLFETGGQTLEGYVERYYLAYSDEELIRWEEEYLLPVMEKFFGKSWESASVQTASVHTGEVSYATAYGDINSFPLSYQSALLKLKQKYPNWTFVKQDCTELKFNDIVNAQYGERSYIWASAPSDYREGQTSQANWYYASKKAITYYLDPRKHLSEDEVFQFEQLTYNSSYHTESSLNSILSNTFMYGTIPGDNISYARAFIQIGANYGVSPYHLANRVIQEQGTQGTSPMISGTYPGYQGYYNYFNVGAGKGTDEQVIKNGLQYAKNSGWNTRYKSLSGGAGTIGNSYIKIGQDTLYLQKFQVKKFGGYGLYQHQYMQNIQAPTSEGKGNYNTYSASGSLNNRFVFKIPVYTDMPAIVREIRLSEAEHTLTITQEKTADGIKANCESFTLTATVIDTDGKKRKDVPVTFTSSNKTIATADPVDKVTGKVTAVSGSKKAITITASAGGKSATCKVTVLAPLYELSIIPPEGEVRVGASTKLQLQPIPLYTTDEINLAFWESSDDQVAEVKKGTVTGLKKGTATIKATVTCDDNRKVSAEYKLTVLPCVVQFYKQVGSEWLKWDSYEMSYGDTLEGLFPDETELTGHEKDVFSGWYTKKGGEGVRCLETTRVYGNMDIYPYFISTDQDFFVKSLGDYVYTGAAIKPEVEVYDGDVLLVKGVDYTVSYANNKAVASKDAKKAPTVTVKGKGNYAGTQKVKFNIVQKNLQENDITVEDLLYTYTGKTITPAPSVYYQGRKLAKNKDYKVICTETGTGAYKSAGTFVFELQGMKNFTGTKRVYMKISNNVLMSKVSVAAVKAQTYDDGNEIKPALKVTYKKKLLKENEDYIVTYSNNREIGTATATIEAIEKPYNKDQVNFVGSKTIKFKITGIPMNRVKVTGLTTKTYCGVPITIFDEQGQNSGFFPDFSITYTKNGLTNRLELGTDYTVSYQKNERNGKATVIFTGSNHYSGVLKKTFKINSYNLATNPEGYIILKEKELGEQNYSRAGVTPKIELYFKGMDGTEELLTEKTDYVLTYSNHKKINDGSDPIKLPSITIKGKGRFTGTWKQAATFTVGAKDINDPAITVTASDQVYKAGKTEYPPKLVVKDGNKGLKLNKDYRVVSYTMTSSSADTGVMEYEAEIEAMEKPDGTREYQGTRKVTYRVFRFSLGKAAILAIPKQTYVDKVAKSDDGICPEITVTYKIRSAAEAELFNELHYEKFIPKTKQVVGAADGTTIILKKGDTVLLQKGRDYTNISYQNNKKKGTARVTIYGMDLFSGSKTAKYSIISRVLQRR